MKYRKILGNGLARKTLVASGGDDCSGKKTAAASLTHVKEEFSVTLPKIENVN